MPLQDNAIVDVAEAQEWLGSTTLNKATVENFINRSSDVAERFTSHYFRQRSDKTVYYDGTGMVDLVLGRYPVISVTSLHVDADRDFGDDTLWSEGTDFVVYKDTGALSALNSDNVYGIWPTGIQNIKVVYSYGYTEVPGDVKHAVLIMVQDMFPRIGTERAVKKEKTMNYEVEYAQTQAGPIPKEAYDILVAYTDVLGNLPACNEV
jgi:hypothetical protein